ncbi:hypothetical protein GH733_001141 [Mirounga leonina]|nr:hypothetical protein GH733_001141 [Mirounga leonina]
MKSVQISQLSALALADSALHIAYEWVWINSFTFDGNNLKGTPDSSSAKTQQTAQTSTGVPYCVSPTKSAGERYMVATLPITSFHIKTFGTIFSGILCLDQPTPLFELIADKS